MLRVTAQNLRDLGWSRVTHALSGHATSPPAAAAALTTGPLPDFATTQLVLERVRELGRLLDRGADLPLGGVPDIHRAVFARARGTVLPADDIFLVGRLAAAMVDVRQHLRHHAPALPAFAGLLPTLPDLKLLATEILGTFDDFGRVRDDASPELASARQRLNGLHRSIKDRLERYVNRPDLKDILQDSFYTQREDRYVVPVVASFQKEVPGIIHGTSNTGETVFVEPHEFVEVNNNIKVAESEVRHALEAVLRERTAWIAGEADALEQALDRLVELDLLQARARLARAMNATIPQFSDDGRIALVAARNPYLLLKGTNVVPNTIEIPGNKSFLVVTGPNTGGKTVTLSTVGMCYLMVAAGMPIPADESSIIAPMRSLAALIGDAQDLEHDLSTFSGHLRALQSLLDAVEPESLVLLDEIATGTEPAQGAALAIAVLESLAARGGRGLVTTHYERLKSLPFEDPRFANASVGLDPVTMTPTFVLEGGRPGTSNPFEIALHLGFPPRIVERARTITTRETGGLSEAFARVAAAEAEARDARTRHQAAESEMHAERKRLAAERARLERLAREEVDALYADVRGALRQLNENLVARRKELVRLANEARPTPPSAADISAVDKEIEGLRALQDDARRLLPERADKGEKAPAAEAKPSAGDGGSLGDADVVVGAQVWLRTLEKPAEILDVRGDRISVAVGAVHMAVKRDQLARLSGQAPRATAPRDKSKGIRVVSEQPRAPELALDDVRTPPPRTADITADLRGLRREDVQPIVEPLLDRALREQIEAIWVIHGHGTGAMRDEVREFLARSPYVLGYRPGRKNEGGDGVTIAFLHRT
jgi:DNA mismatch repair protein MutS2